MCFEMRTDFEAIYLAVLNRFPFDEVLQAFLKLFVSLSFLTKHVDGLPDIVMNQIVQV